MQGYGHALPEADRWAIVAYIRALQRSQYAKLDDVESDKRSQLQ
jgi:mono/diheme cytochrome c family protein